MDLRKLFEEGQKEDLFADFQICVRGPVNVDLCGGPHIESGATLFDIASLTKAFTHILFWKLFASGAMSPEDPLSRYLTVPNHSGRQLWHFLSYLVQDYEFDFDVLRVGGNGQFHEVLAKSGFADWKMRFGYDNYSSAYLGMVLETYFGTKLEDILHAELLGGERTENLLFHPVQRGIFLPEQVVPTSEKKDGLVHDCMARSHAPEQLSVAGLFSRADLIAETFHRIVDFVINSGFYDIGSQNQLEKAGIEDRTYAMGFDLPYPQSLETIVDGPIIFAGYTGCRLFFSKQPRVTICFLTNRVFRSDSDRSRKRFSTFTWKVIRQILQEC